MMVFIQKYRLLILVVALLGILGLLVGCDKEEEKSPEDWTREGWQNFEAGDYLNAVTKFTKAINKDPLYTEAYVGIGWSQAKLRNEDEAYNNFSIAIGHDSLRVDAYVGRAGVLFKMNLYEDAIADAKTALSLNGTYQFAHEGNIRFTDLHFLIAEAYYHLTDYDHAKEKVNWLRDLFGLPAISWVSRPIVVDGVAYLIYQEALLKAIEGLRTRV